MSGSTSPPASRNRRLAYLASAYRIGINPEEAQASATAWDAFVTAAPNDDEVDARDTLVTARLARGYSAAAFNQEAADGMAIAAVWACAVSSEPVDPPQTAPATAPATPPAASAPTA